jgi:hypothetical protein
MKQSLAPVVLFTLQKRVHETVTGPSGVVYIVKAGSWNNPRSVVCVVKAESWNNSQPEYCCLLSKGRIMKHFFSLSGAVYLVKEGPENGL